MTAAVHVPAGRIATLVGKSCAFCGRSLDSPWQLPENHRS